MAHRKNGREALRALPAATAKADAAPVGAAIPMPRELVARLQPIEVRLIQLQPYVREAQVHERVRAALVDGAASMLGVDLEEFQVDFNLREWTYSVTPREVTPVAEPAGVAT